MSDEDQTIIAEIRKYRSNLDHLAIIRAQLTVAERHQFNLDVLTALAAIVSRQDMAEAIAMVADMRRAQVALAVFGPALRARLEEGGEA